MEGFVELCSSYESKRLDGAEIYLHVKGYSLARVTHLDLEHELLDDVVLPKRGRFMTVHGTGSGLRVRLGEAKSVDLGKKCFSVTSINVGCNLLNRVLKRGEGTRAWIGGKFGGIYIGFKKEYVERLDGLARELGVEAR